MNPRSLVMTMQNIRRSLVVAVLLAQPTSAAEPSHERSRCFGSVSQGRLEHAH